ncbi:hypothetical protein MLD38_009347 [Melastoma candidum]|uniref:Uncharacterized protein n=1 Tax=Melastoma candidum TaxID=119954 RepID=A0ACB9RZ54_9MYRT|nr:hypothetical protein MLD38_009347 [Melastoma candidum]
MQRFGFTPVDTSSGRLCVSVMYQSSISDICSKPSTTMSPQLIQDYVGSPLADPLKRFPLLPVAHSSPSWSPFSRRHSWSHDQYRVSPPYVSSSPSPTYSEALTSTSSPTTSRLPHPVLLTQPSDPSHVDKVSSGKDETRRLYGMGLPRRSFPRSSGRPLDNDFNEVEHTSPFDVGGDDVTSPGSRTESFNLKGHIRGPLEPGGYLQVRKSTGAAVGALVDLLKKAPPLREDFPISVSTSRNSKSDVLSGSIPNPRPTHPGRSVLDVTPPSFMSSTVLASRTTADALEDLQAYKEMKNLLLSQDVRSRNRTTLLLNKSASKFAR